MPIRLKSSLSRAGLILFLVLLIGAAHLVWVSLLKAEAQETQSPPLPAQTATFSFHLVQEPHTLNPYLYRSGQTSHFMSNLLRGLYRFDSEMGVIEEGAESCKWKSKKRLECRLNQKVRWSSGRVVTAADYVRGFQALIDPASRAVGAELLFTVQNAQEIYQKKKPPSSLGIRALQPDRLVFQFDQPDPEFLAKLTADAMTPVPEDPVYSVEEPTRFLSNGPYVLTAWKKGQKIQMKPNPHYPFGSEKRPGVDIYFIEDDKTALRLYRQGRLSFLRRLPPHLISEFKNSADLQKINTARIDYIGFGPRLREQASLRQSLALSLNYPELQKIYAATSPIGCPGLPENILPNPPCYQFHRKKAEAIYKKLPAKLKETKWEMAFSRMGGKGPEQGAVWMQQQWKEHLGLEVSLQPEEQGVFLSRLRDRPPDLFRKGVPLLYPSCLAALSTFSSKGPENFIGYNNPKFENLIASWSQAETSTRKNQICQEGFELMMNSYAWIPLGRIEWNFLASPKFRGWSLNEMGQLDLSRLEFVK